MGQSLRTAAQGAPDLVITGAVVLDHWGIVKADVGIKDGRIVALGKAGNPDTMDGVHPDLVIGPSHRDPGRQRPDPHRRGHRLPRPPHLPADPGHRARHRDHDDHRRRHRPGRGHQGHHGHRLALLPVVDAHLDGRLAHQPGAARQGQHRVDRRHVGAAAGRRQRLQAPRGLGLDARRHRRLPAGVRRGRGPGVAAHRHAERGRVRGDDPRRDRRSVDPLATTPRARAAATPPTSSPSPACPTCCRARPTRRGPTP